MPELRSIIQYKLPSCIPVLVPQVHKRSLTWCPPSYAVKLQPLLPTLWSQIIYEGSNLGSISDSPRASTQQNRTALYIVLNSDNCHAALAELRGSVPAWPTSTRNGHFVQKIIGISCSVPSPSTVFSLTSFALSCFELDN